MAKLKNSNLIGRISGAVGGTEFVDSPYGPYIRLKGNHVKSFSVKKNISNTHFSNIIRLWSKVTPVQHSNWVNFAKGFTSSDKSGNAYPVRPIDLFKTINRNLLEVGASPMLNPPKKIFPKIIEEVDIDIIINKKKVDIFLFFKPHIEKNSCIIVYATKPLTPGVNSPKPSLYKKIAVLDSSFISGNSVIKEYCKCFLINNFNFLKIGFRLKPISLLSGLTAQESHFIALSGEF